MDNPKYSGKKILIADDDTAIVDALLLLFNDKGFEVESTVRGDRVQQMVQNQPDLLLLDVKMPDKDGRQICRALKQEKDTKNIPVIMISANKDTEKSAKDAGANDFLEKPFEIQDLMDKVEYHINSSN